MNAATHLQALIAAHLGPGTSESAVARWLGMKPQQWSRYILGRTSPKESQINKWLTRCQEGGVAVPASVRDALKNQQSE